MEKPVPNFLSRLKTSTTWGVTLIFWSMGYLIIETIVLFLCEFFHPEKDIDVIRTFNIDAYKEDPESFGNHLFKMNGKEPADSHDNRNLF